MEKAKAAVSDFMHKAGHNDTTVHEKVAPAVVNETIKKTRHDEVQTAIDREVHQDHYHTTVQPIKDREVLPEQHKHHVAAVQERHIDHGDDAAIRRRLEEERGQFRDTRTEASAVHTQSTAATVAGEHVHHHVHETIQPVLQKEVIQPSVVHTTVPIHEVHHKEAKHHTASALPAVSLSEFQRQGGTLAGREERVDGFEGEPKPVGATLGGSSVGGTTSTTGFGSRATGHTTGVTGTTGTTGLTGTTGGYGTTSSTGTTGLSGTTTGYGHTTTGGYGAGHSTSGPHRSDLANKADPRVDSDRDGSYTTGGRHMGTDGTIGQGSHTTMTGATTTGPHASNLGNKLDPRVDSNADGRAGFGR